MKDSKFINDLVICKESKKDSRIVDKFWLSLYGSTIYFTLPQIRNRTNGKILKLTQTTIPSGGTKA